MMVVLLAAGKSSRSSVMKQLYPVNGEYLINLQIKTLLSYGFEVVVVLGHKHEEIAAILDKCVTVVHNENYEAGMFSSVQKAFEVLDDKELLFCHIDRPIPDKSVFKALLASGGEVAVSFYQGEKAPPVYIRSSMKKQLLASKKNRLDYWIEAQEGVVYVEVTDPKVHFNANTDEALEKYFNGKCSTLLNGE